MFNFLFPTYAYYVAQGLGGLGGYKWVKVSKSEYTKVKNFAKTKKVKAV